MHNSLPEQNGYGPRKIGVSTHAVPNAPRLRPIRTADPVEPDAPTSATAVERLRNLPGEPPLRKVDDLLTAAQRYRDIAHVDWSTKGHGSRERADAREEYVRARAYADGVAHARQVMGGAE